jgi:energy-coupling factor transport system ATP-binding protein
VAVAAALARQPSLLISDESTAMVDAEGRALLTDLLASLAADEGLAVVHVTHRLEEAKRADRTLYLDRGHLVTAPPKPPRPMRDPAVTAPAPHAPHPPARRAKPTASGPTLQLSGVGHVYTARSPWAHRALCGVDLTVGPGEAVMVLGHNGSGKSTLAWILAGLLVPSEGDVLLDGQPIDPRRGEVGLSFQHARLQLLRSTVRRDIQAAGGVDAAGADAAMELVGLDAAQLGARSVDQLSGGQQRRVALAGMLARRPDVVVLDEPFAGLDDLARRGLIAVLRRLRSEVGLTLIVVSHDTEGAEPLVDRVVTLAHGRVVADGPMHELTAPASGGPR